MEISNDLDSNFVKFKLSWFYLQWTKNFVAMRQNKETYTYFVEMKVPMFAEFGTKSVYISLF